MKLHLTLLAALAFASSAFAQNQNPTPPGDPNQQRDRGRGNYEDFRKRMAERLKESLKVSDDEWGVIQPLIEKVNTKMRDAMGSRFGGFGGPPRSSSSGSSSSSGGSGGNPPSFSGGGSDPNRSDRAGSAERDALRAALENESSSASELKAKLTAVREQRKRSAAELTEAREELRKVLTVRQEAALVSYGILE